MGLPGGYYVPQGFVEIDLIAVLDISPVPAVLQVSNSLCYNCLFVTEFSSPLLIPERCLFWGACVFSDEDAHFSRERNDSLGSVQERLNIPLEAS